MVIEGRLPFPTIISPFPQSIEYLEKNPSKDELEKLSLKRMITEKLCKPLVEKIKFTGTKIVVDFEGSSVTISKFSKTRSIDVSE